MQTSASAKYLVTLGNVDICDLSLGDGTISILDGNNTQGNTRQDDICFWVKSIEYQDKTWPTSP
jgi:hypothetical protein